MAGPMDIGVAEKIAKMNPQKKERLRKQGKCHICEEHGHIAEHCPDKNGAQEQNLPNGKRQ